MSEWTRPLRILTLSLLVSFGALILAGATSSVPGAKGAPPSATSAASSHEHWVDTKQVASHHRWVLHRKAASHDRWRDEVEASTGSLYAAWSRVAVCEEGGWVGSSGSAFPNSLGIMAAAWYQYGGGSDVTPWAQIAVAERLRHALGIPIPDQGYCAAW